MGQYMSNVITQNWPPKPTFTEKELGDISGKVSSSHSSK